MTTPYQAPVPARFFQLPDGRPSSVQVDPATGGPVAVQTAEQFQHWNMIQAARPLTATERETQLNAAAARPVTPARAEADATFGGSLLDQRRGQAEAIAGTSVVTEVTARPAPVGSAEYEQRAAAATALAASLGRELVYVPVPDAFGRPPHWEIRSLGVDGDLPAVERALVALAREKSEADAQVALWRAHREQLAAEQAERIANLPANRLARLEAKLAEAGIQV